MIEPDDDGAPDESTPPPEKPTDPFVGFDLSGRPHYDYGPGYESLRGAKR